MSIYPPEIKLRLACSLRLCLRSVVCSVLNVSELAEVIVEVIVDQLDDRHLGVIAETSPLADDASVTTWATIEALTELIEELVERVATTHELTCLANRRYTHSAVYLTLDVVLSEGDEALDHGAHLFSLRDGGHDLLLMDH